MIYHKFTVIIIRELFWKINANDMQINVTKYFSKSCDIYIYRLNLIINKNTTKQNKKHRKING